MELVRPLTGQNFDALVLEAERSVIVDFWAPWCGPCRVVSPQVELLASEHPEIGVAKLNVDEAPEIAARYEIYSIPTIVRFERGEVAARVVGALPYPRLSEALGIEPTASGGSAAHVLPGARLTTSPV